MLQVVVFAEEISGRTGVVVVEAYLNAKYNHIPYVCVES